MTGFLDIILLLGLAGALFAPLGYALTTLRGLKGRRLYPIFRFRTTRTGRAPFTRRLAAVQDTARQ